MLIVYIYKLKLHELYAIYESDSYSVLILYIAIYIYIDSKLLLAL